MDKLLWVSACVGVVVLYLGTNVLVILSGLWLGTKIANWNLKRTKEVS